MNEKLQMRWWQIVPADAEIRHEVRSADGEVEPAVVVTPREALERVAETFRREFREPGVLVDTDHASERPEGPTRACGWIKALEVRGDGLYAQIAFTPYGLGLVGDGEYVNRSPAFEVVDRGGGRYEPARLTSLALTNTPAFTNLRVACFSRAGLREPKKDKKMDPKSIAELLGLPAETTPEELSAALTERMSRLRELEQQEADRAEAEAKAEEEAFMAEHKESICEQDRESVRAAFRKDPEGTKRLLAAFRRGAPAAAPGRTLGADAKTPGRTAAQASFSRQAAERDRYVAEVREQLKCSCSMAWNEARSRRPELFM